MNGILWCLRLKLDPQHGGWFCFGRKRLSNHRTNWPTAISRGSAKRHRHTNRHNQTQRIKIRKHTCSTSRESTGLNVCATVQCFIVETVKSPESLHISCQHETVRRLTCSTYWTRACLCCYSEHVGMQLLASRWLCWLITRQHGFWILLPEHAKILLTAEKKRENNSKIFQTNLKKKKKNRMETQMFGTASNRTISHIAAVCTHCTQMHWSLSRRHKSKQSFPRTNTVTSVCSKSNVVLLVYTVNFAEWAARGTFFVCCFTSFHQNTKPAHV